MWTSRVLWTLGDERGDNLFHALVMLVGVAVMAESNQVHFGIVATLTSHPLVVHL